MKLPPLRAVHYFDTVARLNSFSLAAEQLHVSQSAVSHQVRLLEEYLGENLFDRQGRQFQLSPVGERYLDEISPAISAISKASQAVREGEKGSLRLTLYSSLAVKWLVPRLEQFRRLYPEIELTLNMVADDPVPSDQSGDCFITVSPPKRNYHAEFLFAETLLPVCSQRLLKDMHEQGLPDAMWQHPLLSVESLFNQKGKDWQLWSSAAGVEIPASTDMHYFSHMLLAMEAARYHQGIALINDYILQEENPVTGLAILPVPELVSGDNFYFVYKKQRKNQREIQALQHWLKQQC